MHTLNVIHTMLCPHRVSFYNTCFVRFYTVARIIHHRYSHKISEKIMAEKATVSQQKKVEGAPELELSGRPALFENALQQTVDRFTSSIGLSLFKKHFRELYEQDRKGIRAMHHNVVKGLNSKITAEIQTDIAELNLSKRLKTLDDLDSATKETDINQKDAWRPSGNPAQDLKPHRIAVKLKAKKELQEYLRKLQEEDDVLKAKGAQKRKMVTEKEDQLQTKLKQFKKVALACQELPTTEMSKYLNKSNALSPQL